MNWNLILFYLAAYVCGGIPFGVIIARMKGIDILSVGSGNIGATNVKRALGWKFALFVFALDVGKAALPAALARIIVPGPIHGIPAQVFWFLAGFAATVGHCVSPFLRFKGGKGVSTALGMVVGAAPTVAGSAFGLFVILLVTIRYMSLASLIAVTSAIFFGWLLPGQARELVPLYALLAVFVAIRHLPNIRRLRNGTEPKFSLRDDRGRDSETGNAPKRETNDGTGHTATADGLGPATNESTG